MTTAFIMKCGFPPTMHQESINPKAFNSIDPSIISGKVREGITMTTSLMSYNIVGFCFYILIEIQMYLIYLYTYK